MPSVSSLASLGQPDLSPASTPSPFTTRNNLDDKEKQRLLRQTRKLSQILGELPVAPPHPVRGSTPAREVAPTCLSQLHVPSSKPSSTEPSPHSPRFSNMFRTASASTMSPSLLPSVHDDSIRTGPRRRSSIIPAHINQLARFGLGRQQWSGTMSSAHSDEDSSHTDRRSLVAETLSDSSDLHSHTHLHVTRPRNKPRWRSVYSPSPMAVNAHLRGSEDSSMPAYSSKRSVSLWARRRASDEDQRYTLADEEFTSATHPPLTESQRIMSLRRGRKLAQVFGTEPPAALYRSSSLVGDAATSDTVQRERTKTYLALSSGDLRSAKSGRSSRHRSHSSVSSAISISPPSPDPTVNDGEAVSREIECDLTSVQLLSDHDEDPDSTAQGSRDRSENGTAFRRRRLRAAKLSRFFGVAYSDLTGPTSKAVQGYQEDGEGVSPPVGEVGVRIDGPGWPWNRADPNHSSEGPRGTQNADMNDVIALLRQMPRA